LNQNYNKERTCLQTDSKSKKGMLENLKENEEKERKKKN